MEHDIIVEFYPRPADEVRYCAIAYYADTTLKSSVYVLNCENEEQALAKAEAFFRKRCEESKLCVSINCIEILPRNAVRWSNLQPILVKTY